MFLLNSQHSLFRLPRQHSKYRCVQPSLFYFVMFHVVSLSGAPQAIKVLIKMLRSDCPVHCVEVALNLAEHDPNVWETFKMIAYTSEGPGEKPMMGWTVEFILIMRYAWKHSLATQVIPLEILYVQWSDGPTSKCFPACLWPRANPGLLRAVACCVRCLCHRREKGTLDPNALQLFEIMLYATNMLAWVCFLHD